MMKENDKIKIKLEDKKENIELSIVELTKLLYDTEHKIPGPVNQLKDCFTFALVNGAINKISITYNDKSSEEEAIIVTHTVKATDEDGVVETTKSFIAKIDEFLNIIKTTHKPDNGSYVLLEWEGKESGHIRMPVDLLYYYKNDMNKAIDEIELEEKVPMIEYGTKGSINRSGLVDIRPDQVFTMRFNYNKCRFEMNTSFMDTVDRLLKNKKED